ncbi:hypothetical protein WA026_018762 [Henosepilachna vigintioctopunctata]|uniref:BZIP domain-containing protein n=1 Tax=Henosepilachna vigintioctopunctata TaxID=420089 RepID=A0AAW1TP98_9CUCU
MTDFTGDFFLDPGIIIKQEPGTADIIMNTSASVPIPLPRRPPMDIIDYHRDYNIEFENSQSPISQDLCYLGQFQSQDLENIDIWSSRSINSPILKSEALIHMDDDDIFQVDKADLIQGPTLAELNANDETLLREINFDDLLLPEETSTYMNLTNEKGSTVQLNQTSNSHLLNNNYVTIASSCPQNSMLSFRESDLSSSVPLNNLELYQAKSLMSAISPESHSSGSSILQSSPLHMSSLQQKHSTLHDLLMKRDSYASPDRVYDQSLPSCSTPLGSPNIHRTRGHISRLSSSAPTHLGPEQIWQRREPRKHLLSTSSLVEAGSASSLSTGGVMSPDSQDFSHDEAGSDDESDTHYEDFSSDNDSDEDFEHPSKISPSKKERYFWQYNVQSKGPKGQRLVMKSKMEDPHRLNEVTDPVFSPDCSVRGIKHSGKARKGDGNDLTPNPRKLYSIGKELTKLNRTINDMTPVSELPFNVRPNSRKEKNKLASRACRLKKKAQHEANKIKLHGLESEHRRLLNSIQQTKQILVAKFNESSSEKHEELSQHLEKISKFVSKIRIAGHTTEYVNKILDQIKGSSGRMAVLENL